ncbi:MAG: InlB B-repeat-containing protein [Clostridia bacterium]|nr:InlB B-repeat-containing protein [Clostridia bacterium]
MNKLEGTIATDSILELWVYYTRNSYNYTVQYLDKATHAVLHEDKDQTWSGKWEAFVTEHAISIENYTPVAPSEVTIQISASEDENLIIFYYEENKVEINYEAIGGGTVSPEKEEVKVSSGAALGSTATANKGYEFVGWFDNQNGTGTPLSTNSRYIPHKSGSAWVSKTYYAIFREKDVQLNYAVIGPVGSGSVSITQETVKAVSGIANGSTANLASSAYRFVGWFDNADGSGAPLDTNAAFKPTKGSDEIWSDGTTYYAKFEYNLTSLIIDKVFPTGVDYSMDVNQSFIFNVSEVDQNGATVANGVNLIVSIHGDGQITVDGLTVGKYYKITEQTDWSWRYGVCTPTSALESVVNGASIIVKVTSDHHVNKVIFTNVRTNNQWLDGDSWCNNIFK